MPLVLTQNATIKCGHSFPLTLPSGQDKLILEGGKALTEDDLKSAVFSCTNPAELGGPCVSVSAVTVGVAIKTTVGGKGVLLETLVAQANTGLPLVVEDAGQTKFQTM